MSKWQQVKLNDCCASISDGDHQAPPKSESGIPFVTISNIDSYNSLDFSNVMYVPQMYYDKLDNKRKAQKGDIIYSVVGSFGIPVLIKDNTPFVFQRHIAILKPGDDLDSRFLYYTMLNKDFYHKADAVAIGAAQRTISLSALRNLEISLPPIEEQRKIADVLSAYDDLIENNRKQIKLLEEAAQRLYKEWFIDLRFPGHETTPIIDGIPEGWEKGQLGSIIKLRSGFAFKSKDFCSDGTFKIVTIKNVQDGIFNDKNTDMIVAPPVNMPKHCLLSDGNILLSLTGNIGRICMVVGQNFLLNQRVAKIESQYPSFAYCLFRNKDFCDTINNLANGAAQQNLSPVKTEQMNIQIPPEYLLQKFENTTSLLLQKLQILCKDNTKLQESRDYLLKKLL